MKRCDGSRRWRRLSPRAPPEGPSVIARLRQAAPFLIGLVLFVAALEVLRVELRAVTWHELSADVWRTPPAAAHRRAGAHGAQLRRAHRLRPARLRLHRQDAAARPDRRRVVSRLRHLEQRRLRDALGRLGALPLLHALGRHRGGAVADRVLLLGHVLAGAARAGRVEPRDGAVPGGQRRPVRARWLPQSAGCSSLVSPAYLALTLVRSAPLRLGRFELPLPTPAIALGQVLISAIDWALAGAVLYVLLPPQAPGVPRVPRRLPRGHSARHGQPRARRRRGLRGADGAAAAPVPDLRRAPARARGVPRGLLPPAARRRRSWGSSSTKCGCGASRCRRATATLGRLAEELTPRALAALTFVAGLVLLLSGATPAAAGRLALLDRIVPLGVIETSHFLGSIAGAALLDPVARARAPARCRLLRHGHHARRRHRRVAAEGLRLRGGGAAPAHAADPLARPPGLRSARRVLRDALLADVARRRRRRGRRLGVARDVRVQARGLLERAVVAVRAAGRGVAVPARLGRRRHRCCCSSRWRA